MKSIRLFLLVVDPALAYESAIHFSPWMVYHYFRWCSWIFHCSSTIPPGDWYLQHLVSVTVVPASLLGFAAGWRRDNFGILAWIIPTVILLVHMVRYSPKLLY
jgi:hypothetical protein